MVQAAAARSDVQRDEVWAAPEERRPSRLRGRSVEQEQLGRLLSGIRSGRSGVLVIRGEAGIGKTALLEQLVEQASGCIVVRATGVQADMELPFAGLQQLFGSMLGSLERLPDPQREAVEVAFGLRSGPAPDRFEVGLAILGLLAEVAEHEPLVCVVDDAQWLDQASARTLAFVARRLMAETVALVFGVRDPTDEQTFAGLPELIVGGLDDEDARGVLGLAIAGRVDERVVNRIVAETRGNVPLLWDRDRDVLDDRGRPQSTFGTPVAMRKSGSTVSCATGRSCGALARVCGRGVLFPHGPRRALHHGLAAAFERGEDVAPDRADPPPPARPRPQDEPCGTSALGRVPPRPPLPLTGSGGQTRSRPDPGRGRRPLRARLGRWSPSGKGTAPDGLSEALATVSGS